MLSRVSRQSLGRLHGVRRDCGRLRAAGSSLACRVVMSTADRIAVPAIGHRPGTRRRRGLPPIVAPDARVLILGSFPSEASLAARQYYAHPRNHFWPVLAALLNEPLVEMSYPARTATVRAHRIAIWDTIVACERKG